MNKVDYQSKRPVSLKAVNAFSPKNVGLGTVIFFIMALIIYEQELSLKQSSPGSMLTDPFVIREQASEGCSEKMETFSL